jgi:hypothetical protein
MTTIAYEQDYHAWAQHTAELIRQGHFAEIDIEHLVDELEDMGASKERELENRLGILLAHLLKWRYQPERRELAIDHQGTASADLPGTPQKSQSQSRPG